VLPAMRRRPLRSCARSIYPGAMLISLEGTPRACRRLRCVASHMVSGVAVAVVAADEGASNKHKPAPGRLGDSADLYMRVSYNLLHVFQAKEMSKLGEAAAEAAARIAAGGKALSRCGTPHLMWGVCVQRCCMLHAGRCARLPLAGLFGWLY
jgi:hypothetical protein